ncbi:RNA polymerase subunit sigma-70 [Antrihabitans sp. YC3-6]|uniref:RNA polymerase subunit sigma-70 n=1 Tax=Antrihabitans stalagmiti TaxID=2799499 RepID=A0A934NQ79_9NOCA|nr:RNA polymerase subunit sigma-70 [Antrihabitans stalagmiti]MBJ8339414.1 RNA polymerase subunit sigma-70 [Antrihabitans stalagmiti]
MSAAGPEHDLEQYRVELTGYCYRMLASPFDAEDAVQETFVNALRSIDRFDPARGDVRPWLYRIATNICIDTARGRQRRARAMDLAAPSRPGPDVGAPLPEHAWVLPIPDHRAVPAGDPADVALLRSSIRLAFVAALQRLPARQRAVLIFRDVLCWKADEVARLLDTTTASVTSALQRARSTLASEPLGDAQPMDSTQQELLARYCSAFERYDVEALVALLHEDATTSMPPYLWWLRGRADIRSSLLAGGDFCSGARLLPTTANGAPAFGQYLPTGPDGSLRPFALVVFTIVDATITETTTYLDPDRLFALFDLPPVLVTTD